MPAGCSLPALDAVCGQKLSLERRLRQSPRPAQLLVGGRGWPRSLVPGLSPPVPVVTRPSPCRPVLAWRCPLLRGRRANGVGLTPMSTFSFDDIRPNLISRHLVTVPGLGPQHSSLGGHSSTCNTKRQNYLSHTSYSTKPTDYR